jgi:hypothetical protein
MLSSGGAIVEASALTNGQLLIGSTGALPVAATLTGTTHQVNIATGAGSITLSTPQNIDATASPTFGGLTVSATTPVVTITTASGSSRATLQLNANTGTNFALQQDNAGNAIIENYNTTGNLILIPHSGTVNITPSSSLPASTLTLTSVYGTSTIKRDATNTTVSDSNGGTLFINSAITANQNILDDGKGKMSPLILLGQSNCFVNATSTTSCISGGWTQLRNNGTFSVSQYITVYNSGTDTWALAANAFFKISISYRISDQPAGSGDTSGVRIYDTVNNVDILESFAAVDLFGRRCINWTLNYKTGGSGLTFRVDVYQSSGVAIAAQYFNVSIERVG